MFQTPRRLEQRSEAYHQLASLTAAGVGLIQALHMLVEHPPGRWLRPGLRSMVLRLESGASLGEALAASGNATLELDRAVLEAAGAGGRLDTCFRDLSRLYEQNAALVKQVFSNLIYPAVIVHVAVLIFPVSHLTGLVLRGETGPFLVGKALLLGPLYGALLAFFLLTGGRYGFWWKARAEQLGRLIPILGEARRSLALARLSGALESLLGAGVSMIPAWRMAARASGSPAIQRDVERWIPSVERQGLTPADALASSRTFPPVFQQLYQTGEISGRLDDHLHKLQNYFQEEGTRRLKAFAVWLPRLIYWGILLLVAYQIVQFYAGYFSQVNEIIGP